MRDILKLAELIFSILIGLISFAFKIIAFLFKCVVWLCGARGGKPFCGRVRAVDGDSLVLVQGGDELKIRLHGIDAPEYDQPEGPDSARMLHALVNRRDVTIHPISRDRYNRLVAKVVLPNGDDVGREMVRRGMAIAEMRHSSKYSTDQNFARKNFLGFWATGGIIEPAIWRRNRNS